jgi:hypothetical protein
MESRIDENLVINALKQAVGREKPAIGLIIHLNTPVSNIRKLSKISVPLPV